MGGDEDFDAREMDPVRMVGVDSQQFDSEFWNQHLDFTADEWEFFDADDFTTDDEGGGADEAAEAERLAAEAAEAEKLAEDAAEAERLANEAAEKEAADAAEAERLAEEAAEAERLAAEAAEADKGDESSDDEEMDVVVGVRIKQDDGSSLMRKIKLHVKPTTKVHKIVKRVNKSLAKAELSMDIEQLVPLWTPTWAHFPDDKRLIKLLKHSQQGEDEFDAREMDPVRMVGVDSQQFDSEFWNQHLDFTADEWEFFDADDFTTDDEGGGADEAAEAERLAAEAAEAEKLAEDAAEAERLANEAAEKEAADAAEAERLAEEAAEAERLAAEAAEADKG